MEENKQILVIDASVILKWILLEDEDSTQAQKIQEDLLKEKIQIAVPPHCYSEILNILGIKAPEIALNFYSQLLLMKFTEIHTSLEIANQAIEIMKQSPKTSFYDACYHATALIHDGQFITADKNYYSKNKKLGSIKLLKDYS